MLADHERLAWPSGLARTILRGGAGGLVIAIVGRGLSLILAVILARQLGPAGYGSYAFVMAVVTLLAIPVQLGLPNLVVRFAALYEQSQRWDLLSGLLRWSNTVVLVLSVAVFCAGALVIQHFDVLPSGISARAMLWSALLLPLWGLAGIRAGALRGLRRVVIGQLPESLLQPLILTLLVVLAVGLGRALDVTSVVQLTVVAAAGAFLVGAVMLRRVLLPRAARSQAKILGSMWAMAAVPFFLAFSAHLLLRNTDVIMLGYLVSIDETGIYRVASQMALLTAFVTTIVHPVVAPYLTRFHAANDSTGLQQVVGLGSWIAVLGALPVVLAFWFFGEWLLVTLFGGEFAAGYKVLVILTGTHFVYALMTMAAPLLGMTGYAWQAALSISIAATVNLGLNFMLIPLKGSEGAAIATLCSVLLMQLLMTAFAFRSTGTIVPGLAHVPLQALRNLLVVGNKT